MGEERCPRTIGPSQWARLEEREHAREVAQTLARGHPGGGAVGLRTRAETHRRKWRAGAGTARTCARRRQPGGRCRISPSGGEAGGDGDGHGRGRRSLAGATQSGVPGRLASGRASRAFRPLWDATAPPPGPPRTSPHPRGTGGERRGLGWRARVTPSVRIRNLPSWFLGRGAALAPSFRLRGLPPSRLVPGSQARGPAQGVADSGECPSRSEPAAQLGAASGFHVT